MHKRPNILFLMSDEHRADVTGYEGNHVIRTPILDELARTGIVFRNAYSPSPICIPGRQALMSGQFPRTCHCETYGEDLAPGTMTFSRRFSQYAYHTVCAGKLHHLGRDQMQGWTQRIAADTEVAESFITGKIQEEFDRYNPTPGTGKWSNQRELEEARPGDGPNQKFDRHAVSASLDFLERYFYDSMYHRPQIHRPLLFKLSLTQPHYPYFTDQERFDYYFNRVPIYFQNPSNHPVLSLSQLNKPVHVSKDIIRKATTAYYGMIDQVDTYFGQILTRLSALGQNLNDWIIVYTSDHGEMLGEHGIWEKARFYEGSVRVPLIIRWPSRYEGGRVIEENVNLCDIFATLCDLSGIEQPPSLNSRSLVPLMEGDSSGWDNESVSQFDGKHVMIKRDHLKYQYYGVNIPEVLFDLKSDPKETVNLIADPRYSKSVANFRRRLSGLGFSLNDLLAP